jgi:Na+/H+ antiporter NhaD/arsenite permease-like protein
MLPWVFLGLLALPAPAMAAAGTDPAQLDLTLHAVGWIALAVFLLAYTLVILEERTHLAKSKPVMLGAALIWGLIAWHASGDASLARDVASNAFRHIFLEFAELFFFLIVAMTYVSAMTERNVFEALRAELVKRGLGYRPLFWLTGVLAFFLSAVLDNLTTALIMSAVVLAVGAGNARFVSLGFINIVVAANAGGAWSAFGDITTLMVWQAHKVEFFEFFRIFVPSVVNWLVPGALHALRPADRQAPARPRRRGREIRGLRHLRAVRTDHRHHRQRQAVPAHAAGVRDAGRPRLAQGLRLRHPMARARF